MPALRGAPPEEMIYFASVKASFTSVVAVMFTPSKPHWRISSATPSGEKTSYRQRLEVRPIIWAVCAMFEPIMPAAPTIVNFSFVRKAIATILLLVN